MTRTIPELRAAIDAIDDTLVTLFNERSQFVKRVGAIKKSTQPKGNSFIRSGREADMVKRMFHAFDGGTFPPAAAAHMWRIIISASLSLESPLTIAAYAPKETQEIYWFAREYFGNFTPTAKIPSIQGVLNDVKRSKAQVGVLPLPDKSSAGKWWLTLSDDIKIFACIPFILPKGAAIKALAVAKVDPENTGDDVSLFRIKPDRNMSLGRIKSVLQKHKLKMRWLAKSKDAHLLEIKGFVTTEHDAMRELGATVRRLGAYALPITLKG